MGATAAKVDAAGSIVNRIAITFKVAWANPAGEAASCCIEFGGQECHLDVDIENYNYSCKCGDADHNFIWSISDAVYLIGYIFGGDAPPERTCEGDAAGNKLVTISDAVFMISYIFNNGPAPAGC